MVCSPGRGVVGTIDAKTEGVRHLREFPTHGVKVTPSEDALMREADRVTG
jgi:hypothetical protein